MLQLENIKCIESPTDPIDQSKAGPQDLETQGKFFKFPPAALKEARGKAENIHASNFNLIRPEILPRSIQRQ